MISRIYVAPKVPDVRENLYLKSWRSLGLSGRIAGVHIMDSYVLKHELSRNDLEKGAASLASPVLENYSINEISSLLGKKSPAYAIEIGFLPGVTDNIGHTAKETISDLLRIKNDLEVFTSKIFL